ncbi:hypothetical protein JCM6882_009068 [Rhodosporidiobolus microsporus]
MASEDPLLLLRHALSTGQEVQLVSSTGEQVFNLAASDFISFTSPTSGTKRAFPKTTATRFLQAGLPADAGDDKCYDLQALLHAFVHKDDKVPDFLRSANEDQVKFVGVTDRKAVVDYLSGKVPAEGAQGRLKPLAGASPSKRAAEDEADGGAAAGGAGVGAGAGAAGGAAPPAKKQRYQPNREDQEKVKRILQVLDGPAYGHVVGPGEEKKEKSGAAYHNRETVLRGERINNFDSVRALIAPRLKTLRDEQNSKAAAQPAPQQPVAGAKPQKKKQLNPIIIISPSSTALITMHNVKQLLEEARFIPSDLARTDAAAASASGFVTEDVIQINHARATSSAATAETRKARYFIVDGVEALSKFGGAGKLDEAWDRVVCVMTTGQEWQFKPYKWKEPKELFHHVKGVYPQWTSDPPNEKVKSWNVNPLRIDPSKRHVDKSTVAEFWRSLETWIAANKPWLSY